MFQSPCFSNSYKKRLTPAFGGSPLVTVFRTFSSRVQAGEAPARAEPLVEEQASSSAAPAAAARSNDDLHVRVSAEFIDEWGPFTISFHPPSDKKRFGSAEARCPFHALGPKSRCKKYVSLRSCDEAHRVDTLWALRHWCNKAAGCDRQKEHLGQRQLQVNNLPSREEIVRQKITTPAPLNVPTDAELDAAGSSRASAKAAAKSMSRNARSRSSSSASNSSSSSSYSSSSSS